MRPRLSPSFVVAVLALVVATGGTGYAAGLITSRQIADNTIRSQDIRNGTVTGRDLRDRSVTGADLRDGSVTGADVRDGSLTGADLAAGSVPRSRLAIACAAGEEHVFGGCVRRAASGPSSFQAAVDDCNRRDGRLPTTLELRWIAAHDEYGWADGNVSQYEFTGDYTGSMPFTPLGFDRGGNVIPNSSGQFFWHHCVTG
ncbi:MULTISPECIES: hypothetical protein [unclassified Nocardioides]|uniref:hypothetical protein n=1 Tax=unclassified Nocardioides TaxID=2615069 RepID=UPI0030142DCE